MVGRAAKSIRRVPRVGSLRLAQNGDDRSSARALIGMSGRTSHCRGASNWRCGAHLPPASILGRQTCALLGVGTAVATPLRYRGAASAARVVWQESVGDLSEPVRTCRHRLNQRDEVAPTGGTPPQVMDVPVRDGSTWTKRGPPTEHKVRCSNVFSDQAHPSVSWQVASKAAWGAQPEKPSRGRPQSWQQLACPPGAPRRRHRGALAVSSQLMQRIDR